MSACKQRHEKRKVERGRRRRLPAVTHGAAALAAAAVIAAGTSAYADPVRYDNPPGPGHFDWAPVAGQDILDILSDAASQPGTDGIPGAFWFKGDAPYGNQVRGEPGGQVQEVFYYFGDMLPGVDAGVLIPTGYAWDGGAYVTNSNVQPYSLLPEGEETFLGVRFDQGAGNQYGWIGVVRTGELLDAFAWGYETDVGVPIEAGVPEPGSLALLAFGALAVCRRRQA